MTVIQYDNKESKRTDTIIPRTSISINGTGSTTPPRIQSVGKVDNLPLLVSTVLGGSGSAGPHKAVF